MKREEAVRKVTALLRLAGRPGTVAEGATAAAKAQELMDRYEIEQAALQLEGNPEAEADEELMDFSKMPGGSLGMEEGRLSTWVWILGQAVAAANGCYAWTTRKRMPDGKTYRTIEVAGWPSAVETSRYLYGWLRQELLRLREENGRGMGVVWRREFMEGAAAELRDRLRAQRQYTADAMRAAATSSSALMVVNKALAKVENRLEVAKAYATAAHRLRNGTRSGGIYDHGARAAGRSAAQGINLGGARGGRLGSGARKIGGGQ